MTGEIMMSVSEQTKFWQGSFGDEYTDRNIIGADDRKNYFARILSKTLGVKRICEYGANKGHNLEAISRLSRNYELTGVELNEKACEQMAKLPGIHAVHASLLEYRPTQPFDLTFICGVLIHLSPDDLPNAYRQLYETSGRYILINEYFNPVPVEIPYRGHQGKLFKRDFGGEFWDAHRDRVRLVDYGFLWKRVEPTWDDTNWWLFERI